MSRRASNAGGGVSLFPFMSILACLIGILTLMISVTMAVKSLETSGRDKDELARAKEHQSLLSQQKKLQQEIDSIKTKARSQNAAALQLSELDEKRIVLRRQLDEKAAKLKKADQTDKALQKLIETILDNIAALKKERPAIDKKLAELKAELARRKIKPDNKPAPIQVRPGGSGTANVALVSFVECDSTGLILHRRGGPKTNVSLAAIGTDQAYNQFLDEAKRKSGSMVLFLLRDSGNNAYIRAAGWAETQYQLRTGKLPLPGKGDVDLSLFFKR
jgi:hypothetical protein